MSVPTFAQAYQSAQTGIFWKEDRATGALHLVEEHFEGNQIVKHCYGWARELSSGDWEYGHPGLDENQITSTREAAFSLVESANLPCNGGQYTIHE